MTLYLKGHWNYDRSKLELFNLLNKNTLFWNFQVLSLVFPMPPEIHSHTVPHLKALISGNLEPRGLRWGSTLGSARPSLKVLFYYIKRPTVPIFSRLSVYNSFLAQLKRNLK